MTSVIDKILDPQNHTLISLHEDVQYQLTTATSANDRKDRIPPVVCKVWKGGNEYETVIMDNVYPFDTIEHIKHLLYEHYQNDATFLPRFVFIGVPVEEGREPTDRTLHYVGADFLWYASQITNASDMYELNHPLKTLMESDMRFVSEEGVYLSPNYQVRGRSTLETVFAVSAERTFLTRWG